MTKNEGTIDRGIRLVLAIVVAIASYFWLTGYFEDSENGSTDTDEWALANNYISVVPVEIDFTAYDKMDYFKKWNYDIKS